MATVEPDGLAQAGVSAMGAPRLTLPAPAGAAEAVDVEGQGRRAAARRFGALRHRDFALFWVSIITSNTGYWMQLVAQGFLMYQLTGSKTLLGMVGLARAVPMLVFPLFGGVVADRVDRIRLLYITQGSQAALALGLAVLVSTGLVQPWHIIAASFLGAVCGAFDQPARRALTPDLVPKADLMSAVSLESAVFNGAAFTGPAIYGLVAPYIGIAGAFYANAVSYGAVLIALALIRVPPRPAGQGRGNMLASLLEGLRYVRRHRILFTLVLLAAVTSFFARSYQQLLPAFIKDVLVPGAPHETQLIYQSYLTSAAGGGTLLGAFSLAAIGGVRRKGLVLFGSVLAFATLLGLFALSSWYPLSLAVLVGVGAMNLTFGATTSTLLQTIAPPELRGRVMSLYTLCFLGFSPLGAGFTGPLADVIGAPAAVLAGAAVVAVVAVTLALRRPEVRRYE
jgi:MFS family permease